MPSVNSTTDGKLVAVSYPMKEAQQLITKGEYDLIKSLPERKVICIKFIRSQYDLGLYEAKHVVDTIHSQTEI